MSISFSPVRFGMSITHKTNQVVERSAAKEAEEAAIVRDSLTLTFDALDRKYVRWNAANIAPRAFARLAQEYMDIVSAHPLPADFQYSDSWKEVADMIEQRFTAVVNKLVDNMSPIKARKSLEELRNPSHVKSVIIEEALLKRLQGDS